MGDRANVQVISSNGANSVFLYTHWEGTELPSILQRALRRNQRWGDAQYLARIIFCEMIGENSKSETGYGISSVCGDGAGRILVVNTDDQTVTSNGRSVPFKEFVSTPNVGW